MLPKLPARKLTPLQAVGSSPRKQGPAFVFVLFPSIYDNEQSASLSFRESRWGPQGKHRRSWRMNYTYSRPTERKTNILIRSLWSDER